MHDQWQQHRSESALIELPSSHKMGSISFCRILNFICVITLASGAKWPSTIKRCAMNDANMDKCALKQTEQAIAKMSKGLPAIGLKSLDPLRNVSFNIVTKTGPVVIDLRTSNVVITGPSKIQMKKVSFDKKTSTYFIEGYHNLIKMVGNYNIKGSILVFPIDSSGSFDYELRGGFANHSVKMSSNVRSGGHGQVRFDLKSVKSMKMVFHDKLLGEQGSATLSDLVNENMDIVIQSLWHQMEKVVRDVYGEALKPLTSKFNVKDFFPVTSSGRSEADEMIPEDDDDDDDDYDNNNNNNEDHMRAASEHTHSHDSYSYHVQYK